MIAASWQYVRDEAAPRWKDILLGEEFWASLIVGTAFGFWGFYIVPDITKVSDVGIALLTYSAIALGFCLAGLTLVLTLPHENFIRRIIASKSKRSKTDGYSDLLFVFSWTALVHWVILLLSIIILLLWAAQQPILSAYSSRKHRIFAGIVVAVSAYGLFQFLITLITLSQVGRIYIDALKNNSSDVTKPL